MGVHEYTQLYIELPIFLLAAFYVRYGRYVDDVLARTSMERPTCRLGRGRLSLLDYEACRDGYDSMEPFSLKQLVKNYILGIVIRFQEDQVCLYAAQSSFFMLMSIVPFLLILMSLIRLLNLDENVVMTIIENATPSFMSNAIAGLASEVYSNSITIISLSILTTLWSSGKAVQGISYGLNNVMRIEENRNYFVLRFRAILYTLGLILAIFLMIVFMVYGHDIRWFVTEYFKAETTPFVLRLILTLRFLLALVILTLLFTVIYALFPNHESSLLRHFPNGFCCAFSWCVFTYFLSLYVRIFNAFSLYGSMFMIILWMLWLYTCMIIFFTCGQCHPMMLYLFRCLGRKLTGHGPISREPIPDMVYDVVQVGMDYHAKSAERKAQKTERKKR